jgi:uncharacterized protein YbjT (DUF2867 family)
MKVTLIGATGRLGRRLTNRLLAAGHEVIGVGRSPDKVAMLSVPGRIADCYDTPALRLALHDAQWIISCAYAGTAPYVLDAIPKNVVRIVLTGSTRRYTSFPDTLAHRLIQTETRVDAERLPCAIIHPTMVVGKDGKNNVQRMATYISRFGCIPLPVGRRRFLRPIYIGDLASCLIAALTRPYAVGASIIAAGRDEVSYPELVRKTAETIGKKVRIVPIPAIPLMAAAPLTALIPGLPRIATAEVRRLLEDKTFPIDDMRRRLGVEPIGLDEMLARTFKGSAIAESRVSSFAT